MSGKFKDFQFTKLSCESMLSRSKEFYALLNKRRTVRDYAGESFPIGIIENCIRSAGTAPSGANHQPWMFVVVKDPATKRKIRIAAEKEEKEFYESRAPKEWLAELEPLGTNENKPFLEEAPYLIAIFERKYDELPDGSKRKNYYTKESVGIATGMLIAALHNAGIATLTHTPSPMNFLNEILGRPKNERPYLLLVTGFPKENCRVPNIERKALDKIMKVI